MENVVSESADPRQNIADLEERIEQIEARIDSCRKFAAASRFALVLGGLILLGLLVGVLPFDPVTMMGGLAAGLGGVVMLGSNNSTAKEAEGQLADAQAARARLIGLIELRVVGGRETLH
jgi:hypothetical protein